MPVDPSVEIRTGVFACDDTVEHRDDIRRIGRLQPVGVAEKSGLIDLRRRRNGSGDHQGSPCREPVVDHRGDVGDRHIRYHKLPAQLDTGVDQVLSCRIGGVRDGQQRPDFLVGGFVRGVEQPAPRVRTVDQAMTVGRGQRLDESNAVRGDGTICCGCPVTLPGGRVEHDGAVIELVGRDSHEMVGLRAPDLDHPFRDVEIPKLAAQTIDRRLTRDQAVVVGLELIRRHVHLVALAMIDEDMPHPAVSHHLEIS